jgi:hypothetical protein
MKRKVIIENVNLFDIHLFTQYIALKGHTILMHYKAFCIGGTKYLVFNPLPILSIKQFT